MAANILLIGDPHFKKDNKVQTDFLTENVVNFITIRRNDLDGVVVLGDILHRHDKIDLFPLRNAMDFLSKIRNTLKTSAKLWVIVGNHDRPNNKNYLTDEHPFNSLKLWSNTIVVDTVIADTINGKKFLFAPFVEPGRLFEATETVLGITADNIVDSDIAAFFCHQEFRGCNFGIGGKSEIGDVYPKDAPLCISGHIHGSQWVGKNVFYTGIPYEQHWVTNIVSSEGQSRFNMFKPRGIFVLSVGSETNIKRIHLKDSPINLAIQIHGSKLLESCAPNICAILQKLLSETDLKIINNLKIVKYRIKIICDSDEEPPTLKPMKDEFTRQGIQFFIDTSICSKPPSLDTITRSFSHDFVGGTSAKIGGIGHDKYFMECVYKHLDANDYPADVKTLLHDHIFA